MIKAIKTGLKAAAGIGLAAIGLTCAAAPASAQLYLYEPSFQRGPTPLGDALIGVATPGATPAEQRAAIIWNVRAGLNVAALQCQFSPWLRTVDNYNGILDHHSRELAAAYQTLERYFARVHGRTGPRRFDDYSTQTYNNFSTLHAQLGFCQTAARIGREAIAARKGEFGTIAETNIREFRSSLTPVYDNYSFLRMPVPLATLNLAAPDCSRLRGRERRECRRQNES